MTGDHERFMRMALDDAARGKAEGNVAVGSVITRGDTVVARGRNLVASTFDPTAHAETVALREAGRALQRADFSGCVLYTTFEPCPMCCGAILASGISTLVMGGRPTPAERRRHPRVVSLEAVPQTPVLALATAMIEDGGITTYPLRLRLDRARDGWVVSAVDGG